MAMQCTYAAKLIVVTMLQGPEYIFTTSGGYCYINKVDKSVTCVKPEVTLEKVAGTCTHKYTSPTTTFVSHLYLVQPVCDKHCRLL